MLNIIIKNVLLLAMCGIFAVMLVVMFNIIYNKVEQYKAWKQLQEFKEKAVENKIINFYFEKALNCPNSLAKECASMHMERIKKNNKVDRLYKLIK